MEHSPNDPLTVLAQLQAVSGYVSAPVVRLPDNDPILFKRLLDFGALNFMVPDVQDAAQAKSAVASIRYPPAGNRGVSAVTRATRFGRVADYPRLSDAGIALIVRSEEHTSELQSLMRISYAVFCLKKKKNKIFIDISTIK